MTATISHRERPRILVIGGGAAGLCIARALNRRGAAVTVCEAGRIGRGALWASGGMLAAGFEAAAEMDPAHPLTPALYALAERGADLWADWAAALAQETPRAIGWRRDGALLPVQDEGDLARLDAAMARALALGATVDRLGPDQAAALEPSLSRLAGALVFPCDGQLDNRALGPVLGASLARNGVILRENAPVRTLIEQGGRIAGVELAGGGRIAADAVILATGAARSPLHPGLPALTPVKGQMLAFALAPDRAPRRIIRGFGIYLAAKPGGRLVAGATSEPGADDLQTDEAAITTLADRARALCPALADAPIVERWAGLRPALTDLMPAIGATKPDGLFLALGGYRNGVLLAPVMAEALAGLVFEDAAPEAALAAPFTPDRAGLRG